MQIIKQIQINIAGERIPLMCYIQYFHSQTNFDGGPIFINLYQMYVVNKHLNESEGNP